MIKIIILNYISFTLRLQKDATRPTGSAKSHVVISYFQKNNLLQIENASEKKIVIGYFF